MSSGDPRSHPSTDELIANLGYKQLNPTVQKRTTVSVPRASAMLPVYSDFNSGQKLKSLLSQGIKIEYFKFIHTGGVTQSKETDMAPA